MSSTIYNLSTEELATVILNARELQDDEIFNWLEDHKNKSYNEALVELALPADYGAPCDLDEIFALTDKIYDTTKDVYEKSGRIAAIKIHRELTGNLLKDSQEQVDKWIISEGWKSNCISDKSKASFHCDNPSCPICTSVDTAPKKWVGKHNPDIIVRFNDGGI